MSSVLTAPSKRDRFPVLGPIARLAWRCTVYLAVSIAVILTIVGLSVTAFGVGAGRGVSVLWFMPGAVAFSLAAIVGGDIFSAVRRMIGGLVHRGGTRKADTSMDSASDPEPEVTSPDQIAAESGRSWKLALIRRRWRLILLLTMFLPVTAFGAGVFAGRAIDEELARGIADADRDDPFWRFDDLMDHREEVPDEENSALVVADALSLLPDNAWPAARVRPGQQPDPAAVARHQFFDRVIATPANVRLDADVVDAMRVELDEQRDAVEILRKVAGYARGRHELEIGPTLLDTQLPETEASRSAGRLLAADAAIRAHDGDFDGALDSCRAEIGVARSIGDEPFMISQLVRFATGTQAVRMSRRVLGQGEPTDAALARLQALLLDELKQPLLLYAARGERGMNVEIVSRLAAGELDFSDLSDGDRRPVKDRVQRAHPSWLQCNLDLQVAVMLGWMNNAVAIEQRHPASTRAALWKGWAANLAATHQSRFGRLYAWLPLLMTPALQYGAIAFERYQSELSATAILLAAERHRHATGAWPKSIESIESRLMSPAPLDPFTGQPFHLKQRDGQLLVYSLGPNGIDEHGAYDEKARPDEGPDDVGGSVWDVKMRGKPPKEAIPKAH